MRQKFHFALFIVVISLASAWAQGPTETMVIINEDSMDSIALARRFQELHAIPARNMVRISLASLTQVPANAGMTKSDAKQVPLGISPEQFRSYIWEPVAQAAAERGITSEILAWVYSCDFPVRITAPEGQWVSLTGMTFLRGKLPAPSVIKSAGYVSADDAAKTDAPTRVKPFVSPFFAAQASTNQLNVPPSRSMDYLRQAAGPDFPIPSMMLGYTGQRGSTLEEAIAVLERGARASAGGSPSGTVCLVWNQDIRGKTRKWQFPGVQRELKELGVPCVVSDAVPYNTVLAGLMTGDRRVQLGIGNTFQPGAFADHLTSFAAVFDKAPHDKITDWLKAGATASAGPVVEPFANWAKFPHARIFAHQANGCTMLEALSQSVLCPFQLLAVGDPLSAPYSPRVNMEVSGVPVNGRVTDKISVSARVSGEKGKEYGRFRWYVDGVESGIGPVTTLHFSRRNPGVHTILCVARRRGYVRSQVWWRGLAVR